LIRKFVDEMLMHHDPILYELTDADRLGIGVSFGVDIAQVPYRVTGGRLDDARSGVIFNEMIGGHRLGLFFSGRPGLTAAASAALGQADRKVA
jgi:hypothetical protein